MYQRSLPGAPAPFLRSVASVTITSGNPVHKMCWRVRRVDPNLSKPSRDSASSMHYKAPRTVGVPLVVTRAPAQRGGNGGPGSVIPQVASV
jgi:hypothetical protein